MVSHDASWYRIRSNLKKIIRLLFDSVIFIWIDGKLLLVSYDSHKDTSHKLTMLMLRIMERTIFHIRSNANR